MIDSKNETIILNTKQVADRVGISARTLEAWRTKGPAKDFGPPHHKLGGRRVYYKTHEVDLWAGHSTPSPKEDRDVTSPKEDRDVTSPKEDRDVGIQNSINNLIERQSGDALVTLGDRTLCSKRVYVWCVMNAEGEWVLPSDNKLPRHDSTGWTPTKFIPWPTNKKEDN